MMNFTSKHPHYEYLRKKWVSKHKQTADKFLEKHGDILRQLTLSGLGGMMLLSTPAALALPASADHVLAQGESVQGDQDKKALLAQDLQKNLPGSVQRLSDDANSKIASLLSQKFKMNIQTEMEGIRLNRTYGLMGGEQHLYRYPGDTVYNHADTASDWAMYGSAGIAPGLGAYGYFAPSKASFDDRAKSREKYYIAVQTFLSPGFAENVKRYNDFFKFRKMLVVNPNTGQAVVVVIGDAGPSEYTGKSLGGSPEVMYHLGIADGPRKGPILYYFIDDPNDTIPLGPIVPK